AQDAGALGVVSTDEEVEVRFPEDRARALGEAVGRHRFVSVYRNKLRLRWKDAGPAWRDLLADVLTELGRQRTAA
ncbi:MAG: hypothetical protein ACYDGR_13360, partial [Candidatus Dormibacteria bacterium]